jgi:hypothetical protein
MKPEMRENNDRIRAETRANRATRTPYGIDTHLAEHNVAE